jgi:hypothetical protein
MPASARARIRTSTVRTSTPHRRMRNPRGINKICKHVCARISCRTRPTYGPRAPVKCVAARAVYTVHCICRVCPPCGGLVVVVLLLPGQCFAKANTKTNPTTGEGHDSRVLSSASFLIASHRVGQLVSVVPYSVPSRRPAMRRSYRPSSPLPHLRLPVSPAPRTQ